MNNKFMKPAFGGRATLSQTGSMHADYDFAKQWSNIGGSSGSKIESWNNFRALYAGLENIIYLYV